MKFKYKIGDTLNVRSSQTDEEKHNRSSLFTRYHITNIQDNQYIGYYMVETFPGKEFTMILEASKLDDDPDYILSLKETLKKL